MKVEKEWLNLKTNLYSCPYCFKEFSKNGICSHINMKHIKSENFKKCWEKNGKCWNQGLNKENNKSLLHASETLKERYKNGEINKPQLGKKHTEETKNKISSSMKFFLENNPNKVPYLLNHYSLKESYPEKYFREILENNNIFFQKEKRVYIYSLDFLIGNIDLEINGEQHYVDKRIRNSDLLRYKYLENIGYKIIKIRWSKYKKLNQEKKIFFLKKLITFLKRKEILCS